MSNILHSVVENYKEIVDSRKDPLVDSWLFMGSPAPVLAILCGYLFFVLKLGPQYMKNREPFNLKIVLIIYNAYQVLFSLWLGSQLFRVDNAFQMMFQVCNNLTFNEVYAAALSANAWWYFFSKILDLLDTVFFVLRKKQSQVTFLHVYHHSVMMLFTWFYLKFLPGEQGVFLAFLNIIVHSVMYSYYLIAALGPRFRKYIWWKKYMTWMQLGQFFLMSLYLGYSMLIDCKVPKALTYVLFVNVVVFIYLFTDFYAKAYRKPNKKVIEKCR